MAQQMKFFAVYLWVCFLFQCSVVYAASEGILAEMNTGNWIVVTTAAFTLGGLWIMLKVIQRDMVKLSDKVDAIDLRTITIDKEVYSIMNARGAAHAR